MLFAGHYDLLPIPRFDRERLLGTKLKYPLIVEYPLVWIARRCWELVQTSSEHQRR